MKYKHIVLASLCLPLVAFASLPDSNLDSKLGSVGVEQLSIFQTNRVVSAQREIVLTPVALERGDGPEANVEGLQVIIKTGDPIIVYDSAFNDDGEEIVRLQRDLEDNDPAPNDFWVKRGDLIDNEFRVELNSIQEALLQPENDPFADFDEVLPTLEARKGGKHARTRTRSKSGGSYCTSHPTAKHCCYSAVKYALLNMGLTKTRLGGASGYMAAGQLKNLGWSEVGCGASRNPSVGMVCSYHGYTGGNGHAEVWKKCPGSKGNGWYYGAACSSHVVGKGCFSCKVKNKGVSSRAVSKRYHVKRRKK